MRLHKCNKVSEIGKALKVGNTLYLALPLDQPIDREVSITDTVTIRDTVAYLDEVKIGCFNQDSYSTILQHLIHLRYSNDDQIAIMLNKDVDFEPYVRMQAWRDYCKGIAKKIVALYDEIKHPQEDGGERLDT
jgi:hypothetical protein